MGFFGMVLKPGQKEAVEVPPGWCLQLCTAALEPSKPGKKPRDVSATLWVQVEGDIGDSSYLLGSLQGGGPRAQIPVGHCLTSVDGEVIIEAKGGGVVHLTGFFNREYDPDMEYDEDSSEEESSDEEEDEEDEEGEDEGEEGESDEEERGRVGNGRSSKGAGRSVRSAAAAAALICGTGGVDEDSEDDSEVDGEYFPGEGEDSDDGMDDDDEEEEEEEDEEEQQSGKGNGKKRPAGAQGGASPSSTGGGSSADSPSSSSARQRPPKKSRQADGAAAAVAAEAATEEGGGAAAGEGTEGEGNAGGSTSEMTKQERRRQRKRENKRKAAEAKKSLEEAFRAMDPGEGAGEPPVGIPLKNPRTKTLKGGLKIKDTTFGGGKLATAGKNVKICYEGCFPDGRVFDKNNNRRRPLQFRVGMQSVIAGMDRGVEGMRVGGSREIAIPAALGYGARGTGPIPPNQDLVFRVELVDVLGK